jgi:nicotinamide mononucleotide transporter
MTLLEVAANALATASIIAAGRNSMHTWWTGIVGCLLFLFLFRQAHLYADAVLQVFFIASSIAGWLYWRPHDRVAPPIRRVSRRAIAWMAFGALVATLAYGAMLQRFTNAYAPFADSSVLAVSVLAQLLLMRRRIETWPSWLLVNTVAVPLYASRGLFLTAALYAVYWINACIAWGHWRRQLHLQEPAA